MACKGSGVRSSSAPHFKFPIFVKLYDNFMPDVISQRIAAILSILLFFVLFNTLSFLPNPWLERHEIALWVFLAIFFLLLIITDDIKVTFSLRQWPLWLFLISMSGGIINATSKVSARQMYLHILIPFFTLFYIGKYLVSSHKNIKTITTIFCGCAIVISFIAILELIFHRNILYEKFVHNDFYKRYITGYARPMSTLANPAILGSTLLGMLPFNFLLLKSTRLALKIIGWIFFSFILIIILLTASRGVFIGLIIALIFYLWQIKQKWIVTALVSAVCACIIISSYTNNPSFNRFGFKKLIYGTNDSVLSIYRFNRIKITLKMLHDYPIFGVGLNNFRKRFTQYCPASELKTGYEFKVPDNMYLALLAETGIFGLVCFLIFIVWLLKKGLERLQLLNVSKGYDFLLMSVTALIGLLVNMGAYDLFYWYNPYMLFCLLCGFIYGLSIEPK